MRKIFAEGMSVVTAQIEYPWAEVVVQVDGGSMVFESEDDYETWNNQK